MRKLFLSILLFSFFLTIKGHAKENFFEEAKKNYENNKMEVSKFLFQRNIVFNPKDAKSYLYLAKIYKLKNNDRLQEQNLNTVILVDPKNEEAIYLLTLLKVKQSE